MTLKEFNKKFLNGSVTDKDVEVRHFNMTNIDCNFCRSHMRETTQFKKDSMSFFRKLHCVYCECYDWIRTKYSNSFKAKTGRKK